MKSIETIILFNSLRSFKWMGWDWIGFRLNLVSERIHNINSNVLVHRQL